MRNILNRLLNLLLFLVFTGLIGTGMLLKFRLPPGSRGGHGLSALDLSRHEWGDIHFWISLTFLALVALHLSLNWPWIKRVVAPRHPVLLPLAFLAGLALALTPLLLTVRRDPGTGPESRGPHGEQEEISGPRSGQGQGLGRGQGRGQGQGRGLGQGQGQGQGRR